MSSDVCWVLTTGEAGMRTQALGLAEAVGLPLIEKRITLRAPWTWLPGAVPLPLSVFGAAGNRLAPPWPRLVVSCGRRSVGAALAVKRASGGRTLAVHVQNPKSALSKFDLVVAMEHDGVGGPNVVAIRTALHNLTPERLAEAGRTWTTRLKPDGRPFLGALIGGDSARYRFTPEITAQLLRVLRNAAERHGMRVVVTPSRRTGAATRNALAELFTEGTPGLLWDGAGDNPYAGILALADRLVVTSESVSMISEALAAGVPVHVLPLEGHGQRHAAFLAKIADAGLIARIEGDDLDWAFAGGPPLPAPPEPAARVRAMLGL
jgi:mitochondrial fission protein ELM1